MIRKNKKRLKRTKVAIIGTGNIGTDLLIKIQRSNILECSLFTGVREESKGIQIAKRMGVNTSIGSINAIVADPGCCEIVFDATSVDAHRVHAPILKKLNKFTIDLTPSRIGKMCVPMLNLDDCLGEQNVNMVTCGGQATTPIINVIKSIHPETEYVEVVASISSKSAGIGTRNNIDEYTQTTSESIRVFAGIPKSKAIIILNPAEPPILMHNTIYAVIKKPKLDKLKQGMLKTIEQIKSYVPGYKLILEPVFENDRVTLMIEVVGRGDYLPIYAGNLDIINCAAINLAETYAKKINHN